MLPTVVVATAFIAVLPEGHERGLVPIFAAHVFFNVAVVVRIVGTAWARLDRSLWDAAAALGAGPLQRLLHITVPLLGPALAATSALVFLFCFTSFGVILILGGPERATLETEIYNQAARLFDLRTAAVLSSCSSPSSRRCWQSPPSSSAEPASPCRSLPERAALRRPRGRERLAVTAALVIGLTALAVPIAALVESSSDGPTGYGPSFYRALGEETPALLVVPWHAVLNSLLFAALATALALVVGGLAAYVVARPGASWLDVV